ncbi:MAG: helix-turn-helix domain-containing protein [Bacteroidota bacterium]
MPKKYTSNECTIDFAFQRIGGKHKGRILWHLHNHTVLRYGELRRLVTGITAKMLTQTLRELEEDQLIVKKTYYEVPPKVEYRLTVSGSEFIPFIRHLNQWGEMQMHRLQVQV